MSDWTRTCKCGHGAACHWRTGTGTLDPIGAPCWGDPDKDKRPPQWASHLLGQDGYGCQSKCQGFVDDGARPIVEVLRTALETIAWSRTCPACGKTYREANLAEFLALPAPPAGGEACGMVWRNCCNYTFTRVIDDGDDGGDDDCGEKWPGAR